MHGQLHQYLSFLLWVNNIFLDPRTIFKTFLSSVSPFLSFLRSKRNTRNRPLLPFLKSNHSVPPLPCLMQSSCWCFILHRGAIGQHHPESSPGWLSGKESTCLMQEMWVRSLDQEDPLEEEMATHSSIFAWKIPRTKEAGGLESMESQRAGHNLATKQ